MQKLKGKKEKKAESALQSYLKKNAKKDITDWCSKNMPCPDNDRPCIRFIEYMPGNPPRMSSRDVEMQGYLPFNFSGKDMSECVMEFLDMRLYTLDQSGSKSAATAAAIQRYTFVALFN